MNQSFMKEKPVLPLVLSMSMPMVISMLVTSLYNIVDSYFVAGISEEAMTALSLVYPLQLLENSIAVGFGIGINAAAAYYLGAKQSETANDAVSVGILLSFVHGFLMTIIFILTAPHFLEVFTSHKLTLQYGQTYSNIVFAFTIPYIIGITFEKIFQAEGQMVVSMASMMLGCVVNIILDPLLIFGIGPFSGMGVKGAALATGIGQVISLLTYIIIYIRKPLPLKLRYRREMFHASLCRRIYAVGIPASINMGLPSLLITALNGILAAFSETYVLVLGIYFKLQTFIYLTANGIVQGIRPIVGYNYGAREYRRVDMVFKTALRLAFAVMLAGTIICFTASGALIALFTDNPDTVHAGQTALYIICFGFTASAVSVTVSGVLEGLGQGKLSLIISFMRYIVVTIPAAFFLSRLFGAVGVWHAFWISELITAIAAWTLYQRKIKRTFPEKDGFDDEHNTD